MSHVITVNLRQTQNPIIKCKREEKNLKLFPAIFFVLVRSRNCKSKRLRARATKKESSLKNSNNTEMLEQISIQTRASSSTSLHARGFQNFLIKRFISSGFISALNRMILRFICSSFCFGRCEYVL